MERSCSLTEKGCSDTEILGGDIALAKLYETLYIPGAEQLGWKTAGKEHSMKNGAGVTCLLDSDVGNGCFWAYAINEYCGFSLTDVQYKSSVAYKYEHPSFLVVESCTVKGMEGSSGYLYNEGDNLLGYYVPEGVHNRITPKNMHTCAASFLIMPEFLTTVLAERYKLDTPLADMLNKLSNTLLVPEINNVILQVVSYTPRGQAASLFYEAKLLELFSIVLDEYEYNGHPRMVIGKTDVESIHKLAAHLKIIYNQHIDFQRLAVVCYMSKTKMRYVFREVYGMTIMEYVQSLRLHKAKGMLAESDVAIGQISQAVGYTQQGTFTDFFSRSTGLTPKEYRKKYGQQ